jgi:hypothetical protein
MDEGGRLLSFFLKKIRVVDWFHGCI